MGKQPGASGHWAVPHTADMQVEAWSPTVAGCIGEAVRAVVEGFADTSGAAVVGDREYAIKAASNEDLLVSVLDEVVYRMDAYGEIPLDVDVREIRSVGDGRGLSVRFRMADTGTVVPVGAVPKAVSLYDLQLQCGAGGWTCRVTLDV
ncbi:archease [Streptomyces sp. NPDC058316]|uniref:archease n=1 Tax=unclassified Streptomyces TaxID=2593676 RepID=UPI0033265C05